MDFCIEIEVQDIIANEKREFFKKFYPELLTSNKANKQLIEEFVATEEGKELEKFLKDRAWEADSEGETRVYLVKDENGSVVLFFSLKCGLLFKKYQYDELEEDKREFVNLLIEAIQQKDDVTLSNYFDSEMYSTREMEELFKIAHSRVELKMEENELRDGEYTLKVEECYAAIEIQHLCKNSVYKKTDVPIGFGIFWEIIVPLVCEITNKIGCKYLYLFAADHSMNEEVRKLVQYYKNELKFSDVEDIMLIKPYYDKDCLGLVQEVSKLQYNRNAVWEEFSDVGCDI